MAGILAATVADSMAAEEMEAAETSGELLIKKCLSHPNSCGNASVPLESSC
jgi:hypothetical protein